MQREKVHFQKLGLEWRSCRLRVKAGGDYGKLPMGQRLSSNHQSEIEWQEHL